MQLAKILSQVKTDFKISESQQNIDEISVEDIAIDSRLVKKNTVFFALQGKSQDGAKFINDAIKSGASVIVAANYVENSAVTFIKSNDVFSLLVEFLKIFYQPLPANIYAITGTNGKTSTAEFTRQILAFLGKKSASIGSLGIITNVAEFNNNIACDLTTPDLVTTYKVLYNLKKVQVDDVAIEASSIGLEQGRIAGINIEVGAFTNFSQDHLDYHKSMQNYFDCKMILFEKTLPDCGAAVINSDIVEFEKIKKICAIRNLRVIEYGYKARDLTLKKIEKIDFGQRVFFDFNQKSYSFFLNQIADFQVFNALCALANVLARFDLSESDLQNLLLKFENLSAAQGRMQRVALLSNKAQIFIDHSHKPDALENVLKLAKKITKARVLVLFGCGGNRDALKRPIMGKIASNLADFVIVSDDNPRLEKPEQIRAEILAACNMAKTVEIADRKVAIEKAVKMLQDGDILILAGKGHEKYQIIGDKKFKFDEEEIVRNIIS